MPGSSVSIQEQETFCGEESGDDNQSEGEISSSNERKTNDRAQGNISISNLFNLFGPVVKSKKGGPLPLAEFTDTYSRGQRALNCSSRSYSPRSAAKIVDISRTRFQFIQKMNLPSLY